MLNNLKYGIKLCIAYTLFYSGILHLYRRIFLNNDAIVLMYHRVLSEEEKHKSFSHEGIIVHKETFNMHLCFLKKYFNVLPVDEFAGHITKKIKFKRHSCLITFDDGWIDNYTVALPILSEHRIPAVIFLATAFIDSHNQFWQEELASLLYALCKNSDTELLREYNLERIISYPTELARAEIKKYVSRLKLGPKKIPQGMIADASLYLRKKYGDDDLNNNVDSFINWTQVNEMMALNIDFGSHTVNHEILPKLNNDSVNSELSKSKSVVESKIKKQVRYFAYPNGDYNDNISNIVKKCGYDIAFTTEHGTISQLDNPYKLKRINIHNDITNNIPMFYCHILGIF